MMDRRCYCCGKVGHKSPQCWYKDRPKSEWVINKEKEKEKENNKQTPQVNQTKQIVLLLVQRAAIKTGASDEKIYRSKRREKMKFPTFTMDLGRLLI